MHDSVFEGPEAPRSSAPWWDQPISLARARTLRKLAEAAPGDVVVLATGEVFAIAWHQGETTFLRPVRDGREDTRAVLRFRDRSTACKALACRPWPA